MRYGLESTHFFVRDRMRSIRQDYTLQNERGLSAITVHEKIPVVAGTGSRGVIAEAFRQAWRNCIGFIASLIAALGTLLPLGVIVAVVAWTIWRARRSHKTSTNAGG